MIKKTIAQELEDIYKDFCAKHPHINYLGIESLQKDTYEVLLQGDGSLPVLTANFDENKRTTAAWGEMVRSSNAEKLALANKHSTIMIRQVDQSGNRHSLTICACI